MRNLIVIQDALHALSLQNPVGERISIDSVVSMACNQAVGKLYILTEQGKVLCFDTNEGLHWKYTTSLFFEGLQEHWFQLDYVAVTNTVVCISKEGSLVCIEEDGVDGTPKEPDQIGMIEGGISSAKWHPDYSCLVMLTNNNTLICMSNTWDVLNEVEIPKRNVAISGCLTWKGDGELLAMVTSDLDDNIAKVRIYNPQLEVVATSRNVGEGTAAIMKGIGSIVAFATNGSYVATHQAKPGGGHQVALIEKNGLRHGDFDIRTPQALEGYKPWEVTNIEWDLTSTLVAVGLKSTKIDANTFQGCVQIYYRENYHWYLKQQWIDQDLAFLGFDPEIANKLYITQTMLDVVSRESYAALRVIDVYWSMSRSETRDSSVCVTDGAKLLYTPLGYNTVPPPMSMFQESFEAWDASLKSAVTKQSVFWNSSSTSQHRWGNAILLNDQGDLLFTFGDDRGKITRSFYSTFQMIAKQILGEDRQVLSEFSMIKFRNVVVTEDQDHIVIYLLGSKAKIHDLIVEQIPGAFTFAEGNAGGFEEDTEDVIVGIASHFDTFYSAKTASEGVQIFTSMRLLDGFAGRVYHMSAIVNTNHDVAIGISNNTSNNFEIIRLAVDDWQWNTKESLMWLHQEHEAMEDHIIATIPEVSPLFTVISNHKAIEEEKKTKGESEAVVGMEEDEIKDFTVIALSSRNRLYCGDIMLVAGASSYAFNNSFHLLMFITLGTKPHLHFASLPTLQRLQALQQSSEDQVVFECAEPRPVERGAKLITSVANDSKVVIQLPRGNLEVFEPRPMILLKAQRLLVNHQLVDCLVLLRRQRVDLNYLVDFDPTIFMNQIQSFVKEVISSNPDLLSLFITSLETVDVTMNKYYFFDRSMIPYRIQRREYIIANQFEGEKKINQVCQGLRQALLQLIAEQQDVIGKTMNPILCSFAKQKPPSLVEALQVMKTLCVQSKSTKNVVTLPSAIKYLAFLVEGNQLFDAALSVCDFEMARAIARQCQMDPKVYLPLLEGFENIAKGHAEGSAAYYLMHYQVNVHLKKYQVSSDFFVKLLQAVHHAEGNQSTDADASSFAKILSTLYDLLEKEVDYIKQDNLFLSILPKIVSMEQSLRSILLQASAATGVKTATSSINCIRQFIGSVRKAYAVKSLGEMNYPAAINAYLSTYPPSAKEAVEAALAQGNWQQALSIAGRFYHVLLDVKGNKDTALDPIRIAQEIVSNFRQNQEFVSYVGSVAADDGDQGLGSSSSGNGGNSAANEEEDKAILAAKLSIDYCQDAESAVSILTTAHQWTRAVEVACQQNRVDLLDEIFAAGRLAAKELNKFLVDRIQKLPSLVAELGELWKNPAERIENVASTEADLQAELQDKDNEEGKEDVQDNTSEFSAATKYSTSSLLSSASSIRSGTSTVSILSDISDKTSASSQSTSSTAFSIQGLEHSLLSRGTANDYAGENRNANGKVYKRDRTPRRQKRIERSKTKGYSKDVWGLRREKELCQELHKYAQLKSYSKAVNALCELLVSANTAEDHFLATTLTTNMQKLVKLVQTNSAPIAPAYPKEWLNKRAMSIVTFYQDPKQRLEAKLNRRYGSAALTTAREIVLTEGEVEELVQSKTWWQYAKEGIEFWFNSKMLNLLLPQEE